MRPRWRDLTLGMYGAWRLARLDPTAMAWFDRSIGGVARSFWAAALCYPGFLLLLVLRLAPAGSGADMGRVLVVESIGYVVTWTLFPLIILPFCHWIERDEEALDFIIAYNWAQVLQTALTIASLLAALLLPGPVSVLLSLAVLMAQLLYEWFIARTALDAGGVVATVIVLIDIVLSEAMSQVTQSLY